MTKRSAGYSNTPLAKKLGLAPGMAIRVVNAPSGFWDRIALVPDAFENADGGGAKADWQQAFVRSAAELETILPGLREAMHPKSVLWLSWPKGGKTERGEITRDVVREILLRTDLVDVKVCAFDDTWSALKFVVRESARG